MSITAMVDNEVLKDQGEPPPSAADEGGQPAGKGVVKGIVDYVPAEAIAAYVLLLPFMDPSNSGFTGRWFLALGVAVLAALYAIGYRKLAQIQAKTKTPDASFRFPLIPLLATLCAFAAWVFALPTSPFNSLAFYTPELGAAVGVVVATAIAFIASLTGETLTYSSADPAAPHNGSGPSLSPGTTVTVPSGSTISVPGE